MHRRQFLYATALAASAPMAIVPARAAQVATPAGVDASLADRVGAIAPESLLDALLTTPITTPLVPGDLAGITASAWDDANDGDLAGAVGGVAFGVPTSGSEVLAGNAIVHPDAGSAQASFQALPAEAIASEFLGLPWITLGYDDYAVSAVQISYLVLGGGAEAPYDPDAAPDAATSRKLQMRAIDNMVMLIDHLDDVLSALGG